MLGQTRKQNDLKGTELKTQHGQAVFLGQLKPEEAGGKAAPEPHLPRGCGWVQSALGLWFGGFTREGLRSQDSGSPRTSVCKLIQTTGKHHLEGDILALPKHLHTL